MTDESPHSQNRPPCGPAQPPSGPVQPVWPHPQVPPFDAGATSPHQYLPAPKQQRRPWLIALVVAMVLAVAAGVGGYFLYSDHQESVMRERTESEIRKVAVDFTQATENSDIEKMAAQMCADERDYFLDTVNLNTEDDAEWLEYRVDVSDIEIRSDIATAKVSSTSGQEHSGGRLWFRREAGQWKVCAAAQDEWN